MGCFDSYSYLFNYNEIVLFYALIFVLIVNALPFKINMMDVIYLIVIKVNKSIKIYIHKLWLSMN